MKSSKSTPSLVLPDGRDGYLVTCEVETEPTEACTGPEPHSMTSWLPSSDSTPATSSRSPFCEMPCSSMEKHAHGLSMDFNGLKSAYRQQACEIQGPERESHEFGHHMNPNAFYLSPSRSSPSMLSSLETLESGARPHECRAHSGFNSYPPNGECIRVQSASKPIDAAGMSIQEISARLIALQVLTRHLAPAGCNSMYSAPSPPTMMSSGIPRSLGRDYDAMGVNSDVQFVTAVELGLELLQRNQKFEQELQWARTTAPPSEPHKIHFEAGVQCHLDAERCLRGEAGVQCDLAVSELQQELVTSQTKTTQLEQEVARLRAEKELAHSQVLSLKMNHAFGDEEARRAVQRAQEELSQERKRCSDRLHMMQERVDLAENMAGELLVRVQQLDRAAAEAEKETPPLTQRSQFKEEEASPLNNRQDDQRNLRSIWGIPQSEIPPDESMKPQSGRPQALQQITEQVRATQDRIEAAENMMKELLSLNLEIADVVRVDEPFDITASSSGRLPDEASVSFKKPPMPPSPVLSDRKCPEFIVANAGDTPSPQTSFDAPTTTSIRSTSSSCRESKWEVRAHQTLSTYQGSRLPAAQQDLQSTVDSGGVQLLLEVNSPRSLQDPKEHVVSESSVGDSTQAPASSSPAPYECKSTQTPPSTLMELRSPGNSLGKGSTEGGSLVSIPGLTKVRIPKPITQEPLTPTCLTPPSTGPRVYRAARSASPFRACEQVQVPPRTVSPGPATRSVSPGPAARIVTGVVRPVVHLRYPVSRVIIHPPRPASVSPAPRQRQINVLERC